MWLSATFVNGQTALGQILSGTQYKNITLITSLINHEQCEINSLDKDGNNYLQLAILSSEVQCEDIASLLIKKGIHVAHKNHQGKSIFDLIAENKAKRSYYGNIKLLLDILKLHPSSLLEKNSSDKTILGELLRSTNYTIKSEFRTLLEIGKTLNNSSELLKPIISDCFNDFRQNLVSEDTIVSLTRAIIDANITIDVDYCVALTALCNPSSYKDEIYRNLKKLKPAVNLSAVIGHINHLTKENSAERLQGLKNALELGSHLACFDDAVLVWEEQHLRNKTNSSLISDSKMFGHLFSLSGSIPVNNNLIQLTSSFYHHTGPFLTHLMNAYVLHCVASRKHTEHLDAIKQVRNMTTKAMRFYFLSLESGIYYPNISKDSFLSSVLADSKSSGVEIFTGWAGHAVNLIIKQDNFYRNNGGECRIDASTEQYKISKAENLTEAVIAKLYKESNQESNKTYIQRDLHGILGLVFSNAISGTSQTVGNCSLESLLIALKVKYRLFLPEAIADELYADTLKFFEQFYIEEYVSRYSNNAAFPHLLMRLIIQKLVPENKLELAGKLLKEHFTSEVHQEIMHIEFMIKQWKLRINGGSLEEFDAQLQSLGVDLNPKMNRRLQILDHLLNDKVTQADLDDLKAWPLDKRIFQGFHVLHFAVMNNNLVLASSLIQMFPYSVDQGNWFDQEPLCLVQSVEMLDILIKAGASTARTNYDNALDCAIKANKPALVSALLKHGAKPSEYSAYCAAYADPKILQSLMEFHPTAITKPTPTHSTAVHAAAIGGHSENLRTMVYYGGANPAASDVNGVTPLQLALRYGHTETARFLIQYPGTLFNAPYRGDLVVNMTKNNDIKKLIELKDQERKVDLEYFKKFKESNPGIIQEDMDYLILAIRKNDVPAIRGCLLYYPNIKVVNSSKHYYTSPLAAAIQNLAQKDGEHYKDAFEMVQLLLKTPGIDINARMPTSEPMLFMATSLGDLSVLELFLADPKLDPNLQDNVGYTALHDAVERGHLNCVKRLLQDERVDTTLVNQKNKTVLDLERFKYGVKECQDEVAKHQPSERRLG